MKERQEPLDPNTRQPVNALHWRAKARPDRLRAQRKPAAAEEEEARVKNHQPRYFEGSFVHFRRTTPSVLPPRANHGRDDATGGEEAKMNPTHTLPTWSGSGLAFLKVTNAAIYSQLMYTKFGAGMGAGRAETIITSSR